MQKELRLKKNEEFQTVFKRGTSVANRQLVLYVYRNRRVERFRLGISVSKKLGHAVTRNRMKRLIKAIVQVEQAQIRNGYDLVLIVRQAALDMDFDQLRSSFLHVLRKTEAYDRKGRPPHWRKRDT
jgi:ribonuclease P protein component